jgi:hypothetical protein
MLNAVKNPVPLGCFVALSMTRLKTHEFLKTQNILYKETKEPRYKGISLVPSTLYFFVLIL